MATDARPYPYERNLGRLRRPSAFIVHFDLGHFGVPLSVIASLNGDRLAAQSVAAMPTIVVQWNNVALQGIRDTHPGPPMAARMLAVTNTCMFDAWAAYDEHAVGTQFGGRLRRVRNEPGAAAGPAYHAFRRSVRFELQKKIAICYAAYRALVDLFPTDAAMITAFMQSLGLNPNDNSDDVRNPDGIGNVACRAVLAFRHHDGSNQLGDLNGGAPYSDYTGFVPVNTPTKINDPNQWQPLCVPQVVGGPCVAQIYVGPFWGLVKPFALKSPTQFLGRQRPARYGEARYIEQAKQMLDYSADLTDEQKMIAEYWANGPHTELPPGHWNLFASFVSQRDRHDLDDNMKNFFTESNAILDASIAAWGIKRIFDPVRPVTAIHYAFKGMKVRAWGGPNRGTQLIEAGDWKPYQATTFVTPPFPKYLSGHSAFSAAGAVVLRRFTGSDVFGGSVSFLPHTSVVESNTPATTVTLHWATFTDAANQAGISRRYGGIHFVQGDLNGRDVGQLVGEQAYDKALTYINGTAAGRY